MFYHDKVSKINICHWQQLKNYQSNKLHLPQYIYIFLSVCIMRIFDTEERYSKRLFSSQKMKFLNSATPFRCHILERWKEIGNVSVLELLTVYEPLLNS